MKLKQKDRIRCEDGIYEVIAVIWSTVYIQKVTDSNNTFTFIMDEVNQVYRDVEIIGK